MTSLRLCFPGPASLLLVLLLSVGCGEHPTEPGVDAFHATSSAGRELPWEVRSEQGETLLPNLFYAEPSENEQVMPTAILGRYGIDRLIYPTIGNPNLYDKADDADSLTVVLRVEPELLTPLQPAESGAVPDTGRSYLQLQQSEANRLSFFLVPRLGRWGNTNVAWSIDRGSPRVVEIAPSEVQLHALEPDMPEAFRGRSTLRVMFRQQEMQHVPPGLYDLRVELLHDGELASASAGNTSVYEFQYNAVRVFDGAGVDGSYSIVNVSDTQLSVGAFLEGRSLPQLRSFVQAVNRSEDPAIRDAAFITFNGDLHHGGAPAGLREQFVATTYGEEARVVIHELRELELPIFLTPGNHDGSVSSGQVPPDVAWFGGDSALEEVVMNAVPKAWPEFQWEDFLAYRNATLGDKGGVPQDVFVGGHRRVASGTDFSSGWIPVPREERNMILYDGFHTWRRNYGPLNFSWSFGDNHFVSVNTYDLRQHRRSGWGMYTVNYGGGVSEVQLDWIERELAGATARDQDVVLIAHHDPRGGHKAEDHGYYFEQLPYRGIGQSALNYLWGSLMLPYLCRLPDWALSKRVETDCLHDGLQDWMRPDLMYDCDLADRLDDGTCDPSILEPDSAGLPYFSGLALVDTIARHPSVRTVLLGHTHAHSLEVLDGSRDLVPLGFELSDEEQQRFAQLEAASPVRVRAWQGEPLSDDPPPLHVEDVVGDNAWFFAVQRRAAERIERRLAGDRRELVMLRFTSNANQSKQRYGGESSAGFSVLGVSRRDDTRGYPLGQINELRYLSNGGEGLDYWPTPLVTIERLQAMGVDAEGNPVAFFFE